MINRRNAEQCRREVLSIEAQASTTPDQEALRDHLVGAWNAFCREEERRMDLQDKAERAAAVLRLYTFNWSSRSSAGTVMVVEACEEAAWEVALDYHAREDLALDGEEPHPCVAGAHVLVTTEQRPP